ncbi:MAG: HAD family phosphatase [Erysipelotrichaceae bacterium]|jgi:HAD superfamily hydrolase (TIGR01509 family)|nr:HAD family phosphatase [Erysipelotrichaceae bacterium]
MKISAVIFDLDGVVLDSESLPYASWSWLEEKYGIRFDYRKIYTVFGGGGKKRKNTWDSILSAYFDDPKEAEAASLWRRQELDRRIAEKGIPIKDGFWDLWDYLKKIQMPNILATSSPVFRIEREFALCKDKNPFTLMITGDDIVNYKPHPEIFLKAAAKLKVPIEECLILEDSHNGIRAAVASGGIPVMVVDSLPPTKTITKHVYRVVYNLRDIIDLLKENRKEE